jgi:cardiolipin synthase
MNIPNFMTLLRIILVPVLVILFINKEFLKALILFSFLGLTDVLDGFLARVLKQQTVLGAYLDPIADKVLVMSCFTALAIQKIIPGWLAVIVISRDVIILLGIAILSIMRVTFDVKPLLMSKVNTVLQVSAVFFPLLFKALQNPVLSEGWLLVLFWFTAFFTIMSGYQYVAIGVKLINAPAKTGT